MTRRIITLLTDFGDEDQYVAAMKAAILSRDADLVIVDVSHAVPRHDIEAAAFLLVSVHADFPPGTVHVVVVDPGVGSSRLPIALEAGGQRFVGPDNGTFSFVLERAGAAEVRRIEAPELTRETIGATFHGRDVFAPAGAVLARGFPMERVGKRVDDPVMLSRMAAEHREDGSVRGRILHVDHFGNCVTSLTPGDLDGGAAAFRFLLGGATIDEHRDFYQAGGPNSLFTITGSAGFVEVSMNGQSAAELTGAQRGDEVAAIPRGSGGDRVARGGM